VSHGLSIEYSCPDCGLASVSAVVRYRESTEDVVAFMKTVVEPGLSQDHAHRSPHCRPEQLRDIKIPIPAAAQWLFGPPLQ
jgi:hypothetical protein